MKTAEIANTLVKWCNEGKWEACYQEFYSPEILSIEGDGTAPDTVAKGMAEVAKKGEWWQETFEVHSSVASDPVVADNWFSVRFEMDTTHRPSGQRSTSSEIGVYQVKDGKIVREQFFYDMPPEGY